MMNEATVKSYSRVALGVWWIQLAVLIFAIGPMVGQVVMGLLQSANVEARGNEKFNQIAILGFVVALLGFAIMGRVYCLATPQETRARSAVVYSLVLDVLHLTATIVLVWFVLNANDTLAALLFASLVLPIVLKGAAACTFVLFVRRLSQHLNDAAISNSASRLMMAGGALIVIWSCYGLFGVVALWSNKENMLVVGVLGMLIVPILGLAAFVWLILYWALLTRFRKLLNSIKNDATFDQGS